MVFFAILPACRLSGVFLSINFLQYETVSLVTYFTAMGSPGTAAHYGAGMAATV
jgi:hypothetical protein